MVLDHRLVPSRPCGRRLGTAWASVVWRFLHRASVPLNGWPGTFGPLSQCLEFVSFDEIWESRRRHRLSRDMGGLLAAGQEATEWRRPGACWGPSFSQRLKLPRGAGVPSSGTRGWGSGSRGFLKVTHGP